MPVLLLTRPLAQSRAFLADCEVAAGRPLPAVISPLMRIVPTGATPPATGTLVVTSGRAVDVCGDLRGRRVYAVGDRTAGLARRAGAEVISAGGTVDDLVTLLLIDRPGPVCHLRGEHVTGDLIPRLRAACIPADDVIVYRTETLPPTAEMRRCLDGMMPVLAPVFSPRSAAALASCIGTAPLTVLAISPAAARVFTAPTRIEVAAAPTSEAMVRYVVEWSGNLS